MPNRRNSPATCIKAVAVTMAAAIRTIVKNTGLPIAVVPTTSVGCIIGIEQPLPLAGRPNSGLDGQPRRKLFYEGDEEREEQRISRVVAKGNAAAPPRVQAQTSGSESWMIVRKS
jgi:hypothetical protein